MTVTASDSVRGGPLARPFVHGLSTLELGLPPSLPTRRVALPTASSSLRSPARTVRVGEPWFKPSTTPDPAPSGPPRIRRAARGCRRTTSRRRSRCSGRCCCPTMPRRSGIERCSAEDFYKPAHGHIFGAIRALMERGEAIDAVTVTDELKRSRAAGAMGDPSIFISLQANTPSIANARHYAGNRRGARAAAPAHRGGGGDRGHRLRGARGREGSRRQGGAAGVRRGRAPDGRLHCTAARAAGKGTGPDRGTGSARARRSRAWPRATTSWTGSCSASSRRRSTSWAPVPAWARPASPSGWWPTSAWWCSGRRCSSPWRWATWS